MDFLTKLKLPLHGHSVQLAIRFYMIMSRNDWFHHVVTQIIFLRVYVVRLTYYIETTQLYFLYQNIQIMAKFSTNRKVSVQQQLKHHYLFRIRPLFCENVNVWYIILRYVDDTFDVTAQEKIITAYNLRKRTRPAIYIAAVSIWHHSGPISPQTVINRSRVRNIRPRRSYVGPILMRRHPQARLHWCHEHSTKWKGPRDLPPVEQKRDSRGWRVCQRLVQPHTREQLEDGLHEEWRALLIVNLSKETLLWSVIVNRSRHILFWLGDLLCVRNWAF